MVEDLLGKKFIVKATAIQKGDFLQGPLGSAEVVEVQAQPSVVLVDLAVLGVKRLDPTWDVAVYRKEDEGNDFDDEEFEEEDNSGDRRDVDESIYPMDPEPEPWTPASRYS